MGTRSRIALQNSDGSISSIYCHWDGYLSNNGKLLLEHYTDESKVRSLLALGDLSSLGETTDTSCLCEENADAYTSKDHAELLTLAENCGAEFLYLFDGGSWSFKRVHHGRANAFTKLTLETCKD